MAKQTEAEKNFSANELISLIEACGKAGVSELSLNADGFLVRFSTPEPRPEAHQPDPERERERLTIQEKLFAQEEQRIRKDQIDHMAIEDPVRFEELIAAGELEDEADGEHDEEA